MIKTKSIFEPEGERDGVRIIISRFIPKELRRTVKFDYHIKELAPSKELISDWKAKRITWGEYTTRFCQEMDTPKSRYILLNLAKRSMKGHTLTLLCYESERNPHCHRYIVKRLILIAKENLVGSRSRWTHIRKR